MRLLPTLLLVAVSASAMASGPQSAESKGLAIAREADRRGEAFGDFSVQFKMILRDRQGQESWREIRSRTLEIKDDGDKTLIVFDRPRDVTGTALLTFTHKTNDDDRWLYLPAVKRVKRIASNNKTGPFMGSEFAYEDIGSQEIEKYRYKYLRDERCAEMDCFVFERCPTDPESGYRRQLIWMDKAEYRPLKIQFYDRKETLLKTLELKDYQRFLDRYWRPARMDMVNHQSGKSTTLLFQNYRFRNGFTERDFDQNALQAAR